MRRCPKCGISINNNELQTCWSCGTALTIPDEDDLNVEYENETDTSSCQISDEIMQTICPVCRNITYYRDNVQNPYCIVCGNKFTVVPDETSYEKDQDEFTIMFAYPSYMKRVNGCEITVDGIQTCVASINSPGMIRLKRGKHSVAMKIHINGGVNSYDYLSSAIIDVDKDRTYVIESEGKLMHKRLTLK